MTIFCTECGAEINTMFPASKTDPEICRSCEEEQQREFEIFLNSEECRIEIMIEQSMREDAGNE